MITSLIIVTCLMLTATYMGVTFGVMDRGEVQKLKIPLRRALTLPFAIFSPTMRMFSKQVFKSPKQALTTLKCGVFNYRSLISIYVSVIVIQLQEAEAMGYEANIQGMKLMKVTEDGRWIS